MGKRANQAIWEKFRQVDDETETDYTPPTEEDWEAGFSDWKHQKDDDLASAVKRYARPVGHVRLFDELGRV